MRRDGMKFGVSRVNDTLLMRVSRRVTEMSSRLRLPK